MLKMACEFLDACCGRRGHLCGEMRRKPETKDEEGLPGLARCSASQLLQYYFVLHSCFVAMRHTYIPFRISGAAELQCGVTLATAAMCLIKKRETIDTPGSRVAWLKKMRRGGGGFSSLDTGNKQSLEAEIKPLEESALISLISAFSRDGLSLLSCSRVRF